MDFSKRSGFCIGVVADIDGHLKVCIVDTVTMAITWIKPGIARMYAAQLLQAANEIDPINDEEENESSTD